MALAILSSPISSTYLVLELASSMVYSKPNYLVVKISPPSVIYLQIACNLRLKDSTLSDFPARLGIRHLISSCVSSAVRIIVLRLGSIS